MKFLAALLVVLLVALGLAGAAWHLISTAYGPSQVTFVQIAPRTSSEAIAAQLQQAGVIRSRYGFELLRVIRRRHLLAGEYKFDHPAPMTEVYDRIARGDVYTVQITIPEGYNIFDIAGAVEAAGFASRDRFLAVARSQTGLIADLSPGAASLEGYLFPDTYRFPRKETAEQIAAAMVHRFRQVAAQLSLTANIARTVTMASLVEKEVSVDAERPLVAGVFVNRLAKGMPLATDPTVIYAALLDDRYRGTIYASDLKNPSPYNTYVHAGMPPGPIANPGVAALKAAMSPAQTDYLYFVADAQGHSRFSASLQEHDTQVRAYREATGQPVAPPKPVPSAKHSPAATKKPEKHIHAAPRKHSSS